ncbi:hypothetical protein GA830_12125 [Mesorhizobium sp. NBSH29]|uniref:transcription termination/antitermination protein NusG n=1 Tax=Mesorhizobium sp. NBSH29 TaxID=2654249 RepID=UPI001896860E|nr:transcription termination/antitermination NusG family protein [Mesorhizobium sp. NBSH29]QPC87404.1 hypothetical protein GA830_12125 [Mesorhizobium sp. NBSH29]
MMAMNVKRLNDGVERVWLDRAGEPIKLDRAYAASAKAVAERTMEAGLLDAATKDIEGARRWFALRVGARGEIAIRDGLVDARVDAVVPVKEVSVSRRTSARKVVHKPVLSGLVFVNLVPSIRAFAGLLRVRDVYALIGGGDQPHPIGDREMNGFMDLAQAGAFDERNTPTGLKVGSQVQINVGAYAEFKGVIEGYAKGRAARVRTWLFGREFTVDVKLAHLEESD